MKGRVPANTGASSENTGNHRKPAPWQSSASDCRLEGHVFGALSLQKPMGTPGQAAQPLPILLLLISISVSGGIDFPYLPHWITCYLLASRVDESFTGISAQTPCHVQLALLPARPGHARGWHWPHCLCLQWETHPSGLQQDCFPLLVQRLKNSCKFKFRQRDRMPFQRKVLGRRAQSEKGHQISLPLPAMSHKGLRFKRTQPSDPQGTQSFFTADSQGPGGPEFSFDLLPEVRAIRVSIPPGPEASVRLCYQWSLECEELGSPFDGQKIVSGGHTADLPYEFLLPCLCIEASYLQEDTVRRKRCPFQKWPEAYGSDFWNSVHFTDYSQNSQMIMALTLHCPLKLEASLCQRQDPLAPCEDIPNATARESEDWYVLEKVDLHPQLCFKFSFENSSHVECPHQSGSLTSWTVSMNTQAQQLVLHFSSRTSATFSAAWSSPDLGLDTLTPPVYSVSQIQDSGPMTLDLIIPFLNPRGCVLVWRSDVQFAWKHLLCPDVSHRHLGLLTLALLGLTMLLGVALVLICRHLLPGPGQARPVLLLHSADSEAQRHLVGALAELLRAALGGGRNVIVDLWEGTHVAHIGPLPWFWAAKERVAREHGTVLLLWSGSHSNQACSRGDSNIVPLHTLLCDLPRPVLWLVYFSRLCAEGDIPRPLRALPRYRLLRDLPRLLRALDAQSSAQATSCCRLWAKQCLRGHLELCHQLELQAARLDCHHSTETHAQSCCL